jgi:F0F1-type ATP synthase delta subunit
MKISRTTLACLIAKKTLAAELSPKQIAAYLVQEHRTLDIASLMRDIQSAWASDGYVEVIATSAHPIPVDAQAEIVAQTRRLYPAAKQVVVTEQRDESVIAGVRLRMIDYQLDTTARRALQRFNIYAAHGKES